jgi:hypothetical protein
MLVASSVTRHLWLYGTVNTMLIYADGAVNILASIEAALQSYTAINVPRKALTRLRARLRLR